MTTSEQVDQYRNEVHKIKELTPVRASEILVDLTALFGNINTEIRKTAMEYNQVLAIKLKQNNSVAYAKVLAEITEEFSKWKEAKDRKEELLEMIRGLKFYLKSQEQEFREAY